MPDLPEVPGVPDLPEVPGVPDLPEAPKAPEAPGLPDRAVILDDDTYLEPAKPRITARGVAIVGIRVVAGLIGIGVAAVTIAATTLIPLPSIRSTPPGELVTPVATGQQLLCPGAVLRLADEAGQGATSPSALGQAVVRYAASSGAVEAIPLAQSDAANGGTASAPSLLSTPPNAADPTTPVLVAGAQSQTVDAGEFVGFAAADCAVASGDSWLVGGSTVVGRTTLITLSNPTEVPATVDLEIFGENGRVTAPGTSGIIVSPNGQRILSLAGFIPGLLSPVVHVVSRGGQVIANLQQSIVRGLDPGGVDVIGATTAPSQNIVIPGLVLTDTVAIEEQLGGEGSDDLRTVLRLFAPGEAATRAAITLVPEDGSAPGLPFELDIAGGQVLDIPLDEIADGSYTVTIVTDAPVVAGLRVSSTGLAGTDFAWLAAATELTGDTLFVVAEGPNPLVHLANPTATDVQVTLQGSGTDDVSVLVPTGSSVLATVRPGASYLATGFQQLYIAVSFAEDGLIAGYGVRPPGLASTPITVY